MKIRYAKDRGMMDHGWLKAAHTFSFGHYYDPKFMGYGNLRVINDDIIEGGMGFGTHPHRDMEIITFIKEGALEHKDSMGSSSVIYPGEIQVMSAGTGVTHSEFNHYRDKNTKLYQIWIEPKVKGIKPRYDQMNYTDKVKANELTLLVSSDGREGSLMIHQDAEILYGKFSEGIKKDIELFNRKTWIQIVSGEVEIEGKKLETSDGASIEASKISLTSLSDSEILIMHL